MNVMKRAWEIAKEGQIKFGGKVKQYFSISLKMAWEESKQGKKVVSLSQIVIDLNEVGVSRWTAKEWKNYGKHRIYVQSYTNGGWARGNDGYYEVVDGVIASKSVSMREAAREVFHKYQGYKLA